MGKPKKQRNNKRRYINELRKLSGNQTNGSQKVMCKLKMLFSDDRRK